MSVFNIADNISIIYEYLLASGLEDGLPTLDADYPITNMDERDSNLKVRTVARSSSYSPLEFRFDLGEQKLIDAVAIASTNIDIDYGGAAVQMGLTDGDLGTWEHTYQLLYNNRNLCSNGDFEKFSELTVGDPASDGDSQCVNWIVPTVLGVHGKIKAQPYSNSFLPPNDPSTYKNNICGKFITYPTVNVNYYAHVVPWSLYDDGITKNYNINFYIHTDSQSLNLRFGIVFFNASFTDLGSGGYQDYTVSNSNWERKSFTLSLTAPAGTVFAAPYIQTLEANKYFFIDNFQVQIENSTDHFIKSVKGNHLVKIIDEPIPVQYIKFSMINETALSLITGSPSQSSDAFIEFGRLFAGQAIHLGMYDNIGYNLNPSNNIIKTYGNSPVEILSAPKEENFALNFRTWNIGTAEDILSVLFDDPRKQLFLSMFGRSGKNRTLLAHINGNLNTVESQICEYKTMQLTFEQEGE